MRLLHTADWHLGLRFHGYDRLQEQTFFLDWLAQQVLGHGVDALLVCGDVFDTLSPSAAAQRLLYQFLARITQRAPSLQVVLIAGNHDSGQRLEAAIPILDSMRIYVRGVVPRDATGAVDYSHLLVPLRDAGGVEYLCAAVPYLRVSDCPRVDVGSPYVAFFRELAESLRGDARPKIAMAHLYAANAETASSGRALMGAGGLEGISPEAFPCDTYRYVALGHIHRPQRVFGRETARYSGSPLSMSFGERNYHHGVNLVEIAGESVRVEHLPYEAPVRLVELRGSVEEVLSQIAQYPLGEADEWSPIASLVVSVDRPEPTLRRVVEECAEGRCLRLGPMQVRLPQSASEGGEGEGLLPFTGHRLDPLAVAQREYERKYGTALPEPLMERLVEAMDYGVGEGVVAAPSSK